jgi:hypothetical protein
MIRGLLILNSSYAGSRDLFWPPDQHATKSVNVYRAYDAPTDWKKINPNPIQGNVYRDESRTEIVTFTVGSDDWLDNGNNGMRVFRLPHIPYSEVVKGRPVVAYNPTDVRVQVTYIDGTEFDTVAAQVIGIEQAVYLRTDRELPGGGAVSAYPLIDFDLVASIVVTYRHLTNHVDIFTNLVRTYYTVVPIGDHGELHKPGAYGSEVVDSSMVDRMDYMQAEQVRRNSWLFEQVAEPAYLYLRRVRGERCECRVNGLDNARTGCLVCYETGIVGGFYGPFDFGYVDPDEGALRTLEEGGVKVQRTSRSYLTLTPVVQDGDLIIRRNGERLVIDDVNYVRPRGVLLQQDFNVELLNPKDTRYLIPVVEPNPPLIYNPINPDPLDGVGGSEPVYTANTVPGKHWENPDVQAGRTLTFGRIQS